MKHWTKISLVLAIAITTLANYFGVFASLGESDTRTASGIFAQIAATMLGFLIAALSILASISGNRLIRNMQKTGHYKVLLRGLFTNSIAYGIAMIFAIAALMSKILFPWPALIALGFFSFATILLIDAGWKMWLVLHNLTSD